MQNGNKNLPQPLFAREGEKSIPTFLYKGRKIKKGGEGDFQEE